MPRCGPLPRSPASLTCRPCTSCPTHLTAPQKKEFPYNLEQSLFGRELNIPKVGWVLLCSCLLIFRWFFFCSASAARKSYASAMCGGGLMQACCRLLRWLCSATRLIERCSVQELGTSEVRGCRV